ncbi:hypothetical protein ACJX0J_013587, partial [Zea mays]
EIITLYVSFVENRSIHHGIEIVMTGKIEYLLTYLHTLPTWLLAALFATANIIKILLMLYLVTKIQIDATSDWSIQNKKYYYNLQCTVIIDVFKPFVYITVIEAPGVLRRETAHRVKQAKKPQI